jgi:hypothetical protein
MMKLKQRVCQILKGCEMPGKQGSFGTHNSCVHLVAQLPGSQMLNDLVINTDVNEKAQGG